LLALAAANVKVLPLIVPPVGVLVLEYANVVTPTSELEAVFSYNLKM
jgi:hypothetical protein